MRIGHTQGDPWLNYGFAGRIQTAAGKPDDAEDVGGELCKEAIQSVSDLPAC